MLDASIITFVKNKLKFTSREAKITILINFFISFSSLNPRIVFIPSYTKRNIKAMFMMSRTTFHAVFIPVISATCSLIPTTVQLITKSRSIPENQTSH
ncbi:MAG: hypothetical protein UU06_C0037G0001, partial [Parcubacteria group bacterium GW2011_GWB1_40_5]